MEALLVSLSTVFVAEMGDRTQLLSLVLATQYRKPWPIIAGIFVATLANHAAAGFVGVWFGKFLTPAALDAVVGVSMLAMAAWTLIPDKLGDGAATDDALADDEVVGKAPADGNPDEDGRNTEA